MARRVALGFVRAYQLLLGPTAGGRCRFYPSCSEYTAQAVTEHGAARGLWYALRRLVRCGPWSSGGVDLPPARAVSQRG